MLDIVLIAVATGIVFRLAKNKGLHAVAFGMVTILATAIGGFVGAYFLGLAGEILGIFVGGVLLEELVRNMPTKSSADLQVFCPQCGLKQAWEQDKLCGICGTPLRR